MTDLWRVMTANLRKADADDGENAWPHRADHCCRLLADHAPVVLATQETRDVQAQALDRALPGHQRFGPAKGPADPHPINATWVECRRCTIIGSGGWWLSQTPHVPGSRSWGSLSVRLVTRVELATNQGRLTVYATHLDHGPVEVRLAQLECLLAGLASEPDDRPLVLCGDLNATAASPVLDRLRTAGWRDAWTEATGRPNPRGTFHGFAGPAGENQGGAIDWILLRGPIRAREVGLVDAHHDGRYPSDHYFVWADLAFTNHLDRPAAPAGAGPGQQPGGRSMC